MIQKRPADERGHANHGWLKTWHSFSFAEYYDPDHMGFSVLRVINEDFVAPGRGFGMHGHRDMEIVTYVMRGTLRHQDNLGNTEDIEAGMIQRMTAGSGIMHAETNPSADEEVHLFQIWLLPDKPGLTPGYEQKPFPVEARRGRWQLIAAPDAEGEHLRINQDTKLLSTIVPAGASITYDLAEGRHAWIQLAQGNLDLNGTLLTSSDAAAVSNETRLSFTAHEETELLLFDLP